MLNERVTEGREGEGASRCPRQLLADGGSPFRGDAQAAGFCPSSIPVLLVVTLKKKTSVGWVAEHELPCEFRSRYFTVAPRIHPTERADRCQAPLLHLR